jgi:hypothetical protein
MADPNAVTFYAQRLKARYDIPGKVFFVNNGSVPPFGGSPGADQPNMGESELQPFATIDYAIGRCLASRGDAIFVLPMHAETVTAPITLDVIGVQIIGLALGKRKPRITINGAVDMFTITAAECRISGLFCTISTTDAATAIVNVAAARARIDNLDIIPSVTSYNVVDVFTLASGGDDCLIEDIDIRNTIVAVNSFISIEAVVARLTVRNFHAYGLVATGGIIDGAVIATDILIGPNVYVGTIGTNIPALTLDGNPTGVVNGFTGHGTDATIANDANFGSALRVSNVRTGGSTGPAAQATYLIPALDT